MLGKMEQVVFVLEEMEKQLIVPPPPCSNMVLEYVFSHVRNLQAVLALIRSVLSFEGGGVGVGVGGLFFVVCIHVARCCVCVI